MVTVGVGSSGPTDQLLSWVNRVAGAKAELKGPVTNKARKADSGYFGGLDWRA